MLCSSNEEKEKSIEVYVETETGGARKGVDEPEVAVEQEQEETRKAENAGLTNWEHEETCKEMMVAIGDSPNDLSSANDGDDLEDEEEEETEQGKLSEDDEPGWVMRAISKMLQQRMERFRQKQMKLDQLTQPGSEGAAHSVCEWDNKYGASDLRVPAVVKPQTDDDAASPAPTTFGEHMDGLDLVPRISQIPQGTSRPGSSHIPLHSGKPLLNISISGLAPAADRNLSVIQNANAVELRSFLPCISPPQLITI